MTSTARTPLLSVLVTAGLVAACSGDPASRPGLPPSASAEMTIVGEGRFLGSFLISVGPAAGTARFEWSGRAVMPTPTATEMQGNFQLDPQGLERVAVGDTIEYHPTDPWRWIFDNRGSLAVDGAEAIRQYKIRDFSYRATASHDVTVSFVGIQLERLDSTTSTVLPGEDLVVEVSGHWTGTCSALDDAGRVVNDPSMTLNPLCRELLSAATP